MKKADWYLIIGILIFAAGCMFFTKGIHPVSGSRVAVSVDNGEKEYYPLNKDLEKTFVSKEGTNVLVIKDGMAYVKEADCKNQVCVNSRPISKNGETIVCLPHKFVVSIVE